MVLRLDPTLPVVWRDPRTVQVGVDPVLAVIPDVSPGIERLFAIVQAGVSESGFAMFASTFGVTPRQAERLRDTLSPALLPADAPQAGARALVLGANRVAADLARLLHAAGALTSDPAAADLVVIVADHVVSPAEHRRWLQGDVPHLPVVTGEAAITIGPLVEPGTTACLHCVGLHQRDRDPAWPAIAAQLAHAEPPAHDPVRSATAVAEAARRILRHLRGDGAVLEGALRIGGDGVEVSSLRFEPHPECRCAAQPESDWAPADASAALPRPSAARVSAVLA